MQTELACFQRKRVRGMTLVELIVVMFLISMVLLATVPSVADWIRNVRVRSTAESIASGMNQARTEAIKQNKVVTFWLVKSPGVVGVLDGSCVRSSTSASWVVSMDDPTGACGATPSVNDAPRIIGSKAAGDAGDGVVIAALDISGNSVDSISFNGFGQPVSGVGDAPISVLDITSGSSGARRLRIAVSTGGDMRLCDRDVSNTDPRRCL
jgi:type IV fimbrial biogenesis protein FimT